MVQVYFHCSSTDGITFDRRGSVSSLTEARDRAAQIMRSMILTLRRGLARLGAARQRRRRRGNLRSSLHVHAW